MGSPRSSTCWTRGRPGEADAVAGDLRWVGARLERFGPAAPAADLSAVGTPRAARLRAVLARTAHLLAPTEPARAVVDVLHSRVADDPDWGPQVTALRDICHRPRLVNRWPLPDLADPALRRVLIGHTGWVNGGGGGAGWQLAGLRRRGRDGADLGCGHRAGTGGADRPRRLGEWRWRWRRMAAGWPPAAWTRTVRIWDAATGQERAILAGHTGGGAGGGGGAGWQLAGLRRRGRDGADLGCGHRAGTGHADRPHRRGGGGGGGAGWQLAGLRQPGPDGADLGCGHRAGTGHPGRPHRRGGRRWRWRRMAAGWPPAAATRRCGSGMWPPGRNGPS